MIGSGPGRQWVSRWHGQPPRPVSAPGAGSLHRKIAKSQKSQLLRAELRCVSHGLPGPMRPSSPQPRREMQAK